jgi:hypothetical protein
VADQEDEAAFRDLEIDVVERARPVGIGRAKRRGAITWDALGVGHYRSFFGAGAEVHTLQTMNFDLTDEQRAIQSLCREFARDEVAPRPSASTAKPSSRTTS